MPNYCYTTEDGRTTVEEFFAMEDRPPWIRLPDGRKAYKDTAAEIRRAGKVSCGLYPDWSDGLGVNVSEIPAAMENWRKLGETVEYHPETGEMKIDNKRQKGRRLKLCGMHNKDGGYGD